MRKSCNIYVAAADGGDRRAHSVEVLHSRNAAHDGIDEVGQFRFRTFPPLEDNPAGALPQQQESEQNAPKTTVVEHPDDHRGYLGFGVQVSLGDFDGLNHGFVIAKLMRKCQDQLRQKR